MPIRILLIEGDAGDAKRIRGCLDEAERAGAEIIHAWTVVEGLGALRSGKVHVTLLGLDQTSHRALEALDRLPAALRGAVIVLSRNGGRRPGPDASTRLAHEFVRKQDLDAGRLMQVVRAAASQPVAHERLPESESRFRAALNITADAIYLVDCASLRVVDVNDAACRSFGYAREELVGLEVARLFAERSADARSSAQEKLLAIASGFELLRADHRRKDGSLVPVEITRRILRAPDGTFLVCIARDLSERLRAEQALRLSTERFRLVAQATHDVVWDHDLETGEVWRNENLATVFGHGIAEPSAAWWEAHVHPDDRERVTRGMREIVATGGRMWQCEYRFRRADGTYASVLDRGVVSRNAAGEPSRMIGAMSDVTARKEAEEKLSYVARFDPVSGLPNRSQVIDRLSQAVAQSRRRGLAGAVLFINLDRFKLVNDTLGHEAGNALLAQFGERLRRCVRGGDTVGRVSADEFATVLADLSRAEDAAIVAQKIRDALAQPFRLEGQDTYATASIGISVFPGDGEDAEAVLKNAGLAMYKVKETTRDGFCFFTAEMNRRSASKLQLGTDLRRALEREEFALHYQPKVVLRHGGTTGFEALLRWNHPQRGMVPPAEFIPALEESGLIVQVGEWVVQEACAQLRRWTDAGLKPLPIAVNLSAKQFRGPDLDAMIRRALAAASLPASLIELEITESSLMDDPAEAVRILENLRAAGIRISVDDFGTGYSSLAYLTRLPLTALKIDGSFVRNADSDPAAASIVRAVIDMAHNLRFTVIAEGVETKAHADFLSEHGCDQAQGYLYARPMPADAASDFLQAARPSA